MSDQAPDARRSLRDSCRLVLSAARRAQSALTTAAELVGATVVALGVGMIYLPAGVIVAGLGLAGVGALIGNPAPEPEPNRSTAGLL